MTQEQLFLPYQRFDKNIPGSFYLDCTNPTKNLSAQTKVIFSEHEERKLRPCPIRDRRKSGQKEDTLGEELARYEPLVERDSWKGEGFETAGYEVIGMSAASSP